MRGSLVATAAWALGAAVLAGCGAAGAGAAPPRGPGDSAVGTGVAPPSSASSSPSSAASGVESGNVDTAPLRSPIDVAARRALVGRALPPASELGEVEIPPLRDIAGVSFYVDDAKSVADPTLKARNNAALAPLRRFVGTVVDLSDRYLISQPADAGYAALAAHLLSSWARADALLGQVNHQGEFEREWTLGSLALAYLKIREAPGLAGGERAEIEAWLARLGAAVRPYYERPELGSNRNNHAYWVGMALAATGIATRDRAVFDWGLARARIGLEQIDGSGFLPLELARGRMALHYHVFALAPLLMLAELAQPNGVDLYDERQGALRRLVARVTGGLLNPDTFQEAAGAAQEIELPPTGTGLAWAELAYARLGGATLRGWLVSERPVRDVRLGGDVTATFGVAKL